MVGHGNPAVRSRSRSRRGVVMTLRRCQLHSVPFQTGPGDVPVDVSHIKDFTKLASHLGIGADKLGFDASLAEVGAHGEICNGGDHGDGGSDIMEDSVWTGLGEGQACESDGGDKHDCADSLKDGSVKMPCPVQCTRGKNETTHPIPVTAMCGDGNVRCGAIDHVVAIGMDSIVCTRKEGHVCG